MYWITRVRQIVGHRLSQIIRYSALPSSSSGRKEGRASNTVSDEKARQASSMPRKEKDQNLAKRGAGGGGLASSPSGSGSRLKRVLGGFWGGGRGGRAGGRSG